jgi:spore coat protein H
MKKTVQFISVATCSILLAGLCSCGLQRPQGWTEETHGKIDPNYDKLFSEQTPVVHRLDIVIAAEDCQAAYDDLESKLSGGGPGQPSSDEDPIFVPVDLTFEGITWYHVGMRYKGNSSLRSAWMSGIGKLAFRLNFEMFEDSYPEIDDQRFFGFEKMTFSNGFKDDSLMRDKLGADIFRNFGVPSARSMFAQVYVDCGDGPVYWGLYTMIEDPSDKMLANQFVDNSGNLYKPEGEGARWGGNMIEEHFFKKNNLESDWSDAIAAVKALQADRSDAQNWKDNLEAVFNVHGYLKYLAVNQTIINWDAYGCMTHNYYVYADPGDNGRLVFLPWDLNEVMLIGGGRDCYADSVMLDEINDGWPLIRYLLDDPEYRQYYREQLQAFLDGVFDIDTIIQRMDSYHDLIAPYVVGPEATEADNYTFLGSSQDFIDSLDSGPNSLKPHVVMRHNAVNQALGQ